MAPIALTSVTPTELPICGGVRCTINGTFVIGTSYTVYVGPANNTFDSPCYGGVYGQGYVCMSLDGTTLDFISPPRDRDTGLSVSVYSAGGLEGHLPFSVDIIEDAFFDTTFEMRQSWTPWYDTGPRRLDLEPRQDI